MTTAGHALPSDGDNKHLGVATCASSTCHGSVSAYEDSNIRQDEFATWQSVDKHSSAYQILMNDQSKRMASKLGIGPAHQADMCLDCHADNVPIAARGEKFQISDGVGCEACHGGSEKWLSSHTAGVSHQDNLDAGLYPTEDSVKRAELCLSCHLGNKNQMITHRIMGAGHPRMSFELDTFTWLTPHFEVDDDYVQRKGNIDGARDWSIGQSVSAITQLETLLDEKAGHDGIFPELVLFDCHACHRLMSNNQWVPRKGTGLGPGIVRFNDANLLMMRHVLAAVDPGLASAISQKTRDFHVATTRSQPATDQAARALLTDLKKALPVLNSAPYNNDTLQAILDSLVKDGEDGQYRDYVAAEQASMAVDSVILAFETNGAITIEQADRLRQKAEGLFDATANEENYNQRKFVNALQQLKSASP